MPQNRISRLFYFDEQGIRALIGQVESWEVIGKKGKVEGNASIEATGKLSLKGLLSRILGTEAEIGGSAKGGISRSQENEFGKLPSSIIGEAQKVLTDSNIEVFDELCDAIKQAKTDQASETFFYGSLEMDVPDLLGVEGYQFAADSGIIQWQKNFGNTALERNLGVRPQLHSVEDLERPPIVMSMSASKLQEGFGRTGHLMVYIRGFNGNNVPLHVFASIRKTPLYFQLKPYAAWF